MKNRTLALLQDLEEAGAVTSTSLTLADPTMTYERYEALGIYLGSMNRSCAFWIGDWLLFGEELFPDRYAQAAELTGLAPQTLANRASVCKHVPKGRRRASLPFAVHAEVAYFEPEEQERWLDLAERSGWTRAQLRLALRQNGDESSDVEVEPPTTQELFAKVCPVCGHVGHPDLFPDGPSLGYQ